MLHQNSTIESLTSSLDTLVLKIETNLVAGDDADSANYKVGLQELKRTILARYSDVETTQAQKLSLVNFVNEFNLATNVVISAESSPEKTGQAITKAIIAARECNTLMEKIGDKAIFISPVAYVLGGFVGFLIGIPLGAVAGMALLIGFIVFAMLDGSLPSDCLPDDPLFWKVLLGAAATIGAFYGAYYGATFLSKKMQYGYESMCRLFKPYKSITELALPLIDNKMFSNDARRAIADATFLPKDLVNEIAIYAGKPPGKP